LSLLEAITLTPMRCAQFLDVSERRTWFGKGMEQFLLWSRETYRKLLRVVLSHRWKVVSLSLLFFALSLLSVGKLNKEFLPAVDQSRFMIRMQTPVGSSLVYTDNQFRQAEDFLLKQREVDRVFIVSGIGNMVNSGFAYVTMKPKGQRGIDPKRRHELTQQEFMGICRNAINKIPDIKAMAQDLSLRAFSASRGFPIEFVVKGPDWDSLAYNTNQLTAAMEKSGLMTDIDTDYKVGQPEMHIIPDRNQATTRGVSIISIGQVINSMIGGVQVGTYPKNGHRYDIRVKLEEDNRSRDQRIKDLNVRNNRNELIPLSEVVRIEEKATLQSITRKDRERAISVYANVALGKSQQAALEMVQSLAKKILPADYHVVMTGSAQTFQESFQDLFLALFLGILVAYMILASQYNSYLDPVTILMALPFSVSGAFLALLITHQSLNIYSMIGLILLTGIVKKNSILLVDFTNKVRARDKANVHDALLEACPIRLRPILMTSIAIIAGAIPVAMAIGPGAESRVPMAVAIIGGVVVSTLLTLFVVPCVYSLLSRVEGKHAHQEMVSVQDIVTATVSASHLEMENTKQSRRKRKA
jgi:multidrug efflux pump subunit AcrB